MRTRRLVVSCPCDAEWDDGEWKATLDGLANAENKDTPLVVEVGEGAYQRRTLHGLPRANRIRTRSLVEFQIDRFFPRSQEPLVVDAAWIKQADGARAVVAVALQRSRVHAILEAARARGYRVREVVPSGRVGDRTLSFLPAEERQAQRRSEARAAVRAASAMVLVTIGALAASHVAMNREAERLEMSVQKRQEELAMARTQASMRAISEEQWATIQGHRSSMGELATLFSRLASIGGGDSVKVFRIEYRLDGEQRLDLAALAPARTLAALGDAGVSQAWRIVDGPTLVDVGEQRWTRTTLSLGPALR